MTTVVNSAGAEARAASIKALLEQRLAAAMPRVVDALTAIAVAASPSIDEEYDALMAEEGGSAAVPRAGDRSGDKDDRTRLIKPEETYLQNAVANPANCLIDGTSVFFGNVPFLETQTTYNYINIQRTSHREHEEVEHQVGPYLFALLEGGSKTIVPVFAYRHKYKLRPIDDNKDKGRDSMEKSFASVPHQIFAPFVLLAAARETLTTALAEMNGA
jgi:hypothetical protein